MFKNTALKISLGLLLGIAATGLASAEENSFSGQRVVLDSSKSFDQVSDAVKSLVAKNGMMVMAEVDQGKMLSMTGLSVKATLFLIGNPNVGKQLFEQDRAVGLYVPLRLFVFTDAQGKTHVAYDKPSAELGQFSNEKVGMVGKMLDKKLEGLASMAAQ